MAVEMVLGFYEQQLGLLAIVCAIALLVDRQISKGAHRGRGIAQKYLVVYAMAMGADWLQGPYVYSLFSEQYGYPDFDSLAAPLVGAWADHYGRRRLCLTFCLTYTLACGCITNPTLELRSNHLVSTTHTFISPFIASAALLVLTSIVIKATWAENYGSADLRLLVLGLTQTCFEGSMYLFVFLWVPALQESAPPSSTPPLGLIFSSFMISMMLGSLLYTTITSCTSSSLLVHARLSSLVCGLGAFALASSLVYKDERQRFWAFCLFEACVGMYYPVQGMLRGTLISNEHRATLSSLFRIPLNIFVIVSLLTGASSARREVMIASALALSFSSLITGVVVARRPPFQLDNERTM
ncbi:hypothetical protein BKA70DRAFT_1372019 [Coprinopsis sp. MPI-PUGE-AT-0042]|nr:hypothetical protein BKA70DRAFT_1372019 [Coprinopsis sp. MPI-PUGE-AT-0042]